MSGIGRRALIGGGLVVGLGGAAWLGAAGAGALAPCTGGRPRLAAREAARRVAAVLVAQGYVPRDTGDPEVMAGGLAAAARADFAAGETVLCDGWVLSRSEADFAIACARAG